MLTNIRKKHRQKDETMSSSKKYNSKIHAEIKDLENLTLCKAQDENAAKLGERDAREN